MGAMTDARRGRNGACKRFAFAPGRWLVPEQSSGGEAPNPLQTGDVRKGEARKGPSGGISTARAHIGSGHACEQVTMRFDHDAHHTQLKEA